MCLNWGVQAPSLEDLRELYNESNLSSSLLKYVPKLKLQRYIMLKGMSAGAKPVSKLENVSVAVCAACVLCVCVLCAVCCVRAVLCCVLWVCVLCT